MNPNTNVPRSPQSEALKKAFQKTIMQGACTFVSILAIGAVCSAFVREDDVFERRLTGACIGITGAALTVRFNGCFTFFQCSLHYCVICWQKCA